MEKPIEPKKPRKGDRHPNTKKVTKKKKKRRLLNFFKFRGHIKRKGYNKFKSSSSENVSSSTDNIPNQSGALCWVNEAFTCDDGNSHQESLQPVVTAANSNSINSLVPMTNDDNSNECISEISVANSEETLSQNETPAYDGTTCTECDVLQIMIRELSNEVDCWRINTEKQAISATNDLHYCRDIVKEQHMLVDQYQREIQHITLTNDSKIQCMEEMIRKLNADVTSLMEVNTSLINKGLRTEDENFKMREELLKQQTKCTDVESENSKLHQNMEILLRKFGKVKREQRNVNYSVSIAKGGHVNVVY